MGTGRHQIGLSRPFKGQIHGQRVSPILSHTGSFCSLIIPQMSLNSVLDVLTMTPFTFKDAESRWRPKRPRPFLNQNFRLKEREFGDDT